MKAVGLLYVAAPHKTKELNASGGIYFHVCAAPFTIHLLPWKKRAYLIGILADVRNESEKVKI